MRQRQLANHAPTLCMFICGTGFKRAAVSHQALRTLFMGQAGIVQAFA